MQGITRWITTLLALLVGLVPRKLPFYVRQVAMSPVWLMGLTNTWSDVAQGDPTSELADKMAGPAASGVTYQARYWLRLALAKKTTNGLAIAQQNPFGQDVLITRAILRITTAGGTGSSVLDVDVVAGATSTGDDILDGVDANTTAVLDSLNSTDNGSNGEGRAQLWEKKDGTNDYVTAKVLVAGASAIVGTLALECIPAA